MRFPLRFRSQITKYYYQTGWLAEEKRAMGLQFEAGATTTVSTRRREESIDASTTDWEW